MLDAINKVYKNIYGVNIRQPFKIEGLKKLSRDYNYDEQVETQVEEQEETQVRNLFQMGGARRRVSGGADVLYDSPFDYVCAVEDNLFMQWLNKFKLVHPALKPQSKTIIIRPDDSEMKRQIEEVKSAMKKDGVTPGTAEDKEYIATHEMKAKQYLWNVFGTRDSKDNRGFEYGINPEFPESGSSTVIRRTSRSGDVFYIKCESKNKITVGTNDSLSNSSTLKFLAKCSNGCYVFGGVLPTPTEHTGDSSTNVRARSGRKNGKRSAVKAHEFFQLVNKYHGDYDAAAYDFIGEVANKCGMSAVLPHYSSDFVHSAFEICFDDNVDISAFDEIFSNSQIDKAHSQLSANFVPSRGKMLDVLQARKFIDNAYTRATHNATSGAEANKLFFRALQDIYSKTEGGNDETLNADIASSMVTDGTNPSAIVELVETMKDGDDVMMNQEIHDNGSISTPMMNILKNKLSAYPFVGFVAKQSAPYINVPAPSAPEPTQNTQDKIDFDDNDDENDLEDFV